MTVRIIDPPAKPRPQRELYSEFLIGHVRWRCELVDHGAYGVETQFWRNEEFAMGRRFDPRLDPARPPREMAIAWATDWRADLERGNG